MPPFAPALGGLSFMLWVGLVAAVQQRQRGLGSCAATVIVVARWFLKVGPHALRRPTRAPRPRSPFGRLPQWVGGRWGRAEGWVWGSRCFPWPTLGPPTRDSNDDHDHDATKRLATSPFRPFSSSFHLVIYLCTHADRQPGRCRKAQAGARTHRYTY